jgi:tellurite resistance protein TehA-like permease
MVWAFWWIDVILSVLSAFLFPMVMFHYNKLTIETMTAGWFLPIVPAVVAGATGSGISLAQPTNRAMITILVSYGLWGIGLSLGLLFLGIYIYRLSVYKTPPKEAIVSVFLPVGLFGQGALAIVQLGLSGKKVFPITGFAGVSDAGEIIYVMNTILGLMLWSFGLWWLIHATGSVSIRIWESGPLKYSLGVWGFIFPLGSYTAGAIALGNSIPSDFFKYLATVMIFPVIILYLLVAFRTLYAVLTGALQEAPCLGELKNLVPDELAESHSTTAQTPKANKIFESPSHLNNNVSKGDGGEQQPATV